MGLGGIAPENVAGVFGGDCAVRISTKKRVKAVNCCHQQRFLLARGPVHRAKHHTRANPATAVAGKQSVGQRWNQKIPGLCTLHQQTTSVEWHLTPRNAANEVLGQFCRWQGFQPRAQHCAGFGVYKMGIQLVIQQPGAGCGHRHHIGQQLVHFQHGNAALQHGAGKSVMVVSCLRNPDHIVKQQGFAIGRCQAHLCQTGAAHQHFAQHADFRINPGG